MEEENEKKKLSDSLVETISKSDLSQVGGELLEMNIDSILTEGVLRDIPVVEYCSWALESGSSY